MKITSLLAACASLTTAAPTLFLNTTLGAGLHLPPVPHVPHVPLPHGINLNLTAIAKAVLTKPLNVTVDVDVGVGIKPKIGIPAKRFQPQKRAAKTKSDNPYTIVTVNAPFDSKISSISSLIGTEN